MTPHLDALFRPGFPQPEPSAQTKTTTETLLEALVPLLGSVKPYVCSGSHATLVVEAGVGARILAFFVLDETTARELGIARYGTPLQHDNGRDYRADALQEALDLYAYIVAADSSDERLGAGWKQAQKLCLAMVQLIAEEAPHG